MLRFDANGAVFLDKRCSVCGQMEVCFFADGAVWVADVVNNCAKKGWV